MLKKLYESDTTINKDKCELYSNNVSYLGYQISNEEFTLWDISQENSRSLHTKKQNGIGIISENYSLVSRVFANGPGDRSSIPGRVIPKTQKIVHDTAFLNTQHYKVRIKGKVKQSREWSNVLPYTSV